MTLPLEYRCYNTITNEQGPVRTSLAEVEAEVKNENAVLAADGLITPCVVIVHDSVYDGHCEYLTGFPVWVQSGSVASILKWKVDTHPVRYDPPTGGWYRYSRRECQEYPSVGADEVRALNKLQHDLMDVSTRKTTMALALYGILIAIITVYLCYIVM